MTRNRLSKKDALAVTALLFSAIVVCFIVMIFQSLEAIVYPVCAIYFGCIFFGLCYFLVFGNARLSQWIAAYNAAREKVSQRRNEFSTLYLEYADLRLTQKGSYDERSYQGKDANVAIPKARFALDNAIADLKRTLWPFKSYYALQASAWLLFLVISIAAAYAPENNPADMTWPLIFSLSAGLIGGAYMRVDQVESFRMNARRFNRIYLSCALIVLIAAWGIFMLAQFHEAK